MGKIGEHALEKALVRGSKEVGQALPAFSDSIRVVEEPGLAWSGATQEIIADKSDYEQMIGGYAARGQEQDASRQMER